MASRFVSAGTSEDAAKEEKEAELRTNDSIKAAKLKLFGKLTREKIEWHPAKLLCIRYFPVFQWSTNVHHLIYKKIPLVFFYTIKQSKIVKSI
jgi:hypothetical protein